jgi:hypothetical protein
MAVFL